MTDNFLDSLSPIQRDAASNIEGSSLIIAGAGSGKTRTLTYRIAHMIQSGIPPHNILSLTFTNKAAKEMRERISSLLPPSMLRGLWMGTFHGIFRRIISKEAHLIDYPENFTLYDTADSTNLVKSIIKELSLPDDKYKPRDVFSRISLAKNNLITAAAYEANAGARGEDEEARRPELYRIYSLYTKRCRANKAMDFDDLLLIMFYLLKNFPEVVDKYSSLFRYILVDEYQDTNHVQYMILKALAAKYRNVCVVGDDSQSIYSFRGARIENILRFEKDFPEAKVFKLEQNYRSTQTIVNASNSLIDHNSAKLKKRLFSSGEMGDKIRVFEAMSDKDEAARVVGDIASTIYNSEAVASDFAILYRTHAQSRVMEEKLRERGIEYRIHEGNSFYNRLEIKAILAYLRLAVNPSDNEALRRVINFPARGIGDTSIQRIEAGAAERGISMFEVLRSTEPSELGIRGVAVGGIRRFVEAFAEFGKEAETMDAYEFACEVAQKSGITAFYRASGAIEDKSRLDNVEELLNSIKAFEMPDAEAEEGVRSDFTIAEWLGEVSLLGDNDKNMEDTTPRVTLMTVHASKGLEYKNIYIVGLEEKLFPSPRAMMSPVEIEEERRLFYVALTRAKSRATLSYALSRFQWGEITDCLPSRFIKEIDEQYLDSDASCGERSYTPKQRITEPNRRSAGAWSNDNYKRKTYPEARTNNSNEEWMNVNKRPNLKRVSSGLNGGAGSFVGGDDTEFRVGDRVSHQVFGKGEIIGIEKTTNDSKLTVEFHGGVHKTLLKRFARLVKL